MRHAPTDYVCPFCLLAAEQFVPPLINQPAEVIYRDEQVVAFIAAGQFAEGGDYPGHVLIVPAEHIENIYDLPDALAGRIAALSRRVSLAFKALGCDGTSTRQHNEPGGNQDVWHYHLHVFPRWQKDELYLRRRLKTSDQTRAKQAARLQPALNAVLERLPLKPSV